MTGLLCGEYGLVYCMLLQRGSVTGLLCGEYGLVYCMLLQRGSVTGLLCWSIWTSLLYVVAARQCDRATVW